jgi:hypothetical protein
MPAPAEMKPCPFCGSIHVHVAYTLLSASGYCENCDATGPVVMFDDTLDDARQKGIEQARVAGNERKFN